MDAQTGMPPEEVWRENETYIRRICAYKLSSHPDEIDDAVQEVALAYYEAVEKGTEIREPKKWLTAVTVNIINDIYRRLKTESEKLVSIDADPVQSLAAPEEAEDLPEAAITACKDAFLSSLTEEEALLFRLRFVKRMKIKAVAKKMGLSEGNVRVRVFRLKQKARRYVRDWADGHL